MIHQQKHCSKALSRRCIWNGINFPGMMMLKSPGNADMPLKVRGRHVSKQRKGIKHLSKQELCDSSHFPAILTVTLHRSLSFYIYLFISVEGNWKWLLNSFHSWCMPTISSSNCAFKASTARVANWTLALQKQSSLLRTSGQPAPKSSAPAPLASR